LEYGEAIARSLELTFSVDALIWLTAGVVLGVIVGILPGVGNGTAYALMLPLIPGMAPIEAFAFFIGLQGVTNIAGEITSVLFAVPGEAGAAAAILDGHPMVKNGEGGRAISANLTSSLVGGVIGLVMMVACLPIIRPFLLTLGNPEFFILILLGVASIATISGRRPLVGWLVAGVGFLLATVGTNPQTGQLRYTFGQLFLWEGVPLLPVVLGLFAIPELVELVQLPSLAKQGAALGSGFLQGIKDTFIHWKLVLQASAIGWVFGVIPGVGGNASQWVVYAFAQSRSKHPELFGKGSIEGVLAPGAANNSKEGGTFLPTLAFGIPGGVGMTILLAIFVMVGVQPGPKMLTDHLDLTMSFVWLLFLAHVGGVGLSLLAIKPLIWLTRVRAKLLVPFIVTLVFMGAYLDTNNMTGVWLMLAFGVAGVVMVRLDWPRAPLFLAFVLGPLAETYLWLSMQLYGFDWLTRPVVFVVGLAIIGSFVWTIYRSMQRRTRKAAA
jgi:putative tricarboxylic transport membrane protein